MKISPMEITFFTMANVGQNISLDNDISRENLKGAEDVYRIDFQVPTCQSFFIFLENTIERDRQNQGGFFHFFSQFYDFR